LAIRVIAMFPMSRVDISFHLGKKLRKIARALDVPFKVLEDMLLGSRLEALGVKEPELLSLFKDIPSLPKRDKRAIINTYLKIKERKKKGKNMRAYY